MPRFTDNRLAQLQLMLTRDYYELRKQGFDLPTIYQNLVYGVSNALSNHASSLYGINDPAEVAKVFTVLNAFIKACPPPSQTIPNNEVKYVFNVVINDATDQNLYYYSHYHSHCYCPTHDTLFTWLMLDAIMNPRSSGYGTSNNNSHQHSHQSNEKKSGDAMAFLAFVVFVAVACALSIIALYYLLRESLNSLERFWYNEGWLQAAVTLASSIVSYYTTNILATIFLSAPLANLALAGGISNPVGAVIFSIYCLSIIGAGAGCFITNNVQKYVIKKMNPEALDPQDPHRFTLTESEEDYLRDVKGLDPTIVKCAIVALRQQIGKEVPSLLNRIFTQNGAEKQVCMDTIRKLRRGELTAVEIGTYPNKFSYDLRPFAPVSVYSQPPVYPPYQQSVYMQQQSPIFTTQQYPSTNPPPYNPQGYYPENMSPFTTYQ